SPPTRRCSCWWVGAATDALRRPSRGNGAERGRAAAGTVRPAVDGAGPNPGDRVGGDTADAGPGRVESAAPGPRDGAGVRTHGRGRRPMDRAGLRETRGGRPRVRAHRGVGPMARKPRLRAG